METRFLTRVCPLSGGWSRLGWPASHYMPTYKNLIYLACFHNFLEQITNVACNYTSKDICTPKTAAATTMMNHKILEAISVAPSSRTYCAWRISIHDLQITIFPLSNYLQTMDWACLRKVYCCLSEGFLSITTCVLNFKKNFLLNYYLKGLCLLLFPWRKYSGRPLWGERQILNPYYSLKSGVKFRFFFLILTSSITLSMLPAGFDVGAWHLTLRVSNQFRNKRDQ